MGGKSGGAIGGYKFYVGVQLGVDIASEPEDVEQEITEIYYGDRKAWEGSVTQNQRITIDKEDLFGGEDGDGGIKGEVDIMFGGRAQAANDYLTAKQGARQPAYRAFCSLVFRHIYYSKDNPLLKDLWLRRRRYWVKWQATLAKIGTHHNPAHIIYECWTNRRWGLGYPESSMHQASFAAAAQTLKDEGFGMTIEFSGGSVEKFIQKILDHIGAASRPSPLTGLVTMKLLRDDYVVDDLPLFDETNSTLLEWQKRTPGETKNEIVLTYKDYASKEDKTISDQNLANIQIQGGIVSHSVTYEGIYDDAVAARLLNRDLKVNSAFLGRGRLRVDRSAFNLTVGDAIRVREPRIGVEVVICRIAEIDKGDRSNRAIEIDVLEDVFALSDSAYRVPEPSGWVNPVVEPIAASPRRLVEAPYWDLARTMSRADLAQVQVDDCYVESLGGRQQLQAYHYQLWTTVQSAAKFERRGVFPFCPNAIIDTALEQEVFTEDVPFSSAVSVDQVETPSYAYVGDECVIVAEINSGAGLLKLHRGALDTVPVAHATGERIWFADGWQGFDDTEYPPTTVIDAKMRPATALGPLPLADAPIDTIVLDQRQSRPYPPGNVTLNGQRYPEGVLFSGVLMLAWSHRDRLLQLADLIDQTAGDIGPEPGTTYIVEVYRLGGLIDSHDGISDTSLDFSPSEVGDVQIRLYSVRDDLVSWQYHSINISYGQSRSDVPAAQLAIVAVAPESQPSIHTVSDVTIAQLAIVAVAAESQPSMHAVSDVPTAQLAIVAVAAESRSATEVSDVPTAQLAIVAVAAESQSSMHAVSDVPTAQLAIVAVAPESRPSIHTVSDVPIAQLAIVGITPTTLPITLVLELLMDGPNGGSTFIDTSPAAHSITVVGSPTTDQSTQVSGSASGFFGGTKDPLSEFLVLRLDMDGSNDGTVFLDSSNQKHVISVVGGAKTVTSDKKFGTASLNLDGSGDAIRRNHSDFALGTGDFHIEMWVNPSSGGHGGAFARLLQTVDYGTDGGITISSVETLDPMKVGMQGSKAGASFETPIQSTTTLANGAWTHIAVDRNSGTTRLFVGGNLEASTTFSYNFTQSSLSIGSNQSGGESFFGRIDHLRIYKGTSKRTSSFVPETDPGTRDGLRINNPNFAFGTGQFTISLWVKPSVTGGFRSAFCRILETVLFGTVGGIVIALTGVESPARLTVSGSNTGDFSVVTTATLAEDTWTRIDVTRDSGNVLRVYVNGSLDTSIVTSYNFTQSSLSIGCNNNGGEAFLGHIDQLRVHKGAAIPP